MSNPKPSRRSRTKLIAGVAVLIAAGVVAIVASQRGDDDDSGSDMEATVPTSTSVPTSGGTASSSPTSTSGGAPDATTGTADPSGPVANIADPSGAFTANTVTLGGIPEDMSWEPSGNFRSFCSFSHLNYDDPIVSPGDEDASHLHMFFGNAGTDHASTYESLRTTGESTCEGGILNRTGYWMPAVLQGEGDSTRVVVPDFFLVYYKGNSGQPEASAQQAEIAAIPSYPNGLRMIAGYNTTDATGSGADDDHVWYCASGEETKTATIPTDCGTGNQLLVAIPFPSCWDGVNLDSPDHRSHMAYGERDPDTGVSSCPSTHPVHLPELTEFAYFTATDEVSTWRLASDGHYGTAPGGSFHADWYGGWSNQAMDLWRKNCINEMRNCNGGDLGDGTGLRPRVDYTGPMLLAVPEP